MGTLRGSEALCVSAVPVSVLLLDDHRVFADVLRLSLDMQPDLHCVAVAYSAHEALAQAAAVDFAVAIVDLDLPQSGGLDVIRRLGELRPHVRVIVLTAHCRPDLAERAVAAGAVAFLGKEGTLDRIVAAVRGADREHPMIDAGLRRMVGHDVGLTHREHDVLRLLALGQDASRIAAELKISLYTARDHIKSLMTKLGAHSQLSAVVAAQQRGLISIGSRY